VPVNVLGISGGLGLADVEVFVPIERGGVERVLARVVDGREQAVAAAELRRIGDRTWSGRLMAGQAPGPLRVAVSVDGVEAAERVAYDAAPEEKHATPDWAKGLVWYQVFPERFRNGEPANDRGHPNEAGLTHPGWGDRWDVATTEELDAARVRAMQSPRGHAPRPDLPGGQFGNVQLARRYGGDLQGVVEKLDHLRAVGAMGLYLTPIFRSTSHHKYDAADYRHVDDALGHPGASPPGRWHEPAETPDPATWKWTKADRFVLDTLLPEAKRRGMRVMFDGVWNHVGVDFWAFQDALRDGADSPYAGWFDARYAGDPEGLSPDDPLRRFPRGTMLNWRGYGSRNSGLPCFLQTAERDLAPGPKGHVFDVTSRWMAPDGEVARGIDGWRLDVAADVGLAFWRDWRRHVKGINPEAVLIGEVWFPAERFFGGEAFDGQMNYPFAQAVTGWLGMAPGMTSQQLAETLEGVFVNHPATDLVQMNLFCSHDTDRLVSMLNNPGVPYDAGKRPGDGYDGTRPAERVYDRAMLGVAILATYMGAPMVYQGEEWGMFGADDPHCRKPIPWPDLPPPADPAEKADARVRDVYAAWMGLRGDAVVGPVLRYGTLWHPPTGDDAVFAFCRQLNGVRVTVVANRGEADWSYRSLGGEERPVPGGTAILMCREGEGAEREVIRFSGLRGVGGDER
jgi:glycosidase